MALVKILAKNLFAGASFQKLEVGVIYDVTDEVADKWIKSNKAEKSMEKKGEKLTFEVATPSVSAGIDDSQTQSQLFDALAQLSKLTDEAEAANKANADALAAEKKRADEAEAALAATTKGK
ncbi:hypothetical protein L580_2737 [Serratia fonticola AU-P3(3)]|nr:hypothetical protein L580_2737 [Serratia fonticola AU-P3(3)]